MRWRTRQFECHPCPPARGRTRDRPGLALGLRWSTASQAPHQPSGASTGRTHIVRCAGLVILNLLQQRVVSGRQSFQHALAKMPLHSISVPGRASTPLHTQARRSRGSPFCKLLLLRRQAGEQLLLLDSVQNVLLNLLGPSARGHERGVPRLRAFASRTRR